MDYDIAILKYWLLSLFAWPVSRTKNGGKTYYYEYYPVLPWFCGLRILGIDDQGIIFKDLETGDELVWFWKSWPNGRWLSLTWGVNFKSLKALREYDKRMNQEFGDWLEKNK